MKKAKKIILSLPTLLLLLNLYATLFVEGKREVETNTAYIIVLIGIWLIYVLKIILKKENKQKKYPGDIITGVYALMLILEILTRITDSINKTLFPCLEDVAQVFVKDWQMMLINIGSSMKILLIGYSIALVLGNLLGLIVGYNERLRQAFFPVAKVISPIPAMVYTPYLIALLPSFNMASISVIAFGLFWPNFMNMIIRVESMEKKIIDSAKTLNANTFTMMFRIILPYSIPSIINGIKVQFSMTFMILVMAEMIGAKTGLGFYVKKFSDYIDFARVFAGIILIGIVILVVNVLLQKLEDTVVKWKPV